MFHLIVIGNGSSEAIRDLGQQKSGFRQEIAMDKQIKSNFLGDEFTAIPQRILKPGSGGVNSELTKPDMQVGSVSLLHIVHKAHSKFTKGFGCNTPT